MVSETRFSMRAPCANARAMSVTASGVFVVASTRMTDAVSAIRVRRRLIELAEHIERTTRQPGRRNGSLGQPALRLYRALVEHFGRNGECFPSYRAISEFTGL